MRNQAQQIPAGPFRFLLKASQPYKWPIFLSFCAVLIGSATSSSAPYVYKRLIDSIGGVVGFGPDNLWFWGMAYVAIGFTSTIFWRFSSFAGMRWSTGVRKTTRETLTGYVVGHSHSFFSNRFAGAINSKISQASDSMSNLVNSFLWQGLEFVIEMSIGYYLVFSTNHLIGWLMVVWLLISAPINIVLFKKKLPLGKASARLENELNAHSVDMLSNINAVRDYSHNDYELKNIYKLIDIRRMAGIKNWMFGEMVVTMNNFIEAIFMGSMVAGSIYLYSLRVINAGDVVLVITLITMVRRTISGLGQQFNGFADTLSTIREGLHDILIQHEVEDIPKAKNLKVSDGVIKFENVGFGYEGGKIFKGLNLEIKSGQKVGLIGRSGAGKSTLVKLLTRQHDLQGGGIFIDDQNIKEVRQSSLREAIATIPQEPLLFHRSIDENIRYGDLAAKHEDIVEAAKQAQVNQFVEILPKKYETLVGERGVKLSGGERQRVAIARAFLKKAKIMILDEATSALDSESEILIQGALEKLMEGKTVIAIAHRLSTLRIMDRLIVMDKGQIVEDGTHEELIKLGGIYAGLWAHQAGGFIKEE